MGKDLLINNDFLMKEWDWEKNNALGLDPHILTLGSNKKAWWLCQRGHSWLATVYNRAYRTGCPVCKRELHTSFPEQALYYYLNKFIECKSRYLLEKYEADIYLVEKHIAIEYNGYFFHGKEKKKSFDNNKKEFFKKHGIRLITINDVREPIDIYCKEDCVFVHMDQKYLAIKEVLNLICDLISIPRIEVNIEDDYLRIMEQYVMLAKENSLAIKNPELAKEWHPTKNGNLLPSHFLVSSSKTVWWLGKCGHEWQAKICNRNVGKGCPYCNQYSVGSDNNLATLYPELAKEWHPTKNGDLLPTQVKPHSNKMVWWLDSDGNEWRSRISTRVTYKTNAPQKRGNATTTTKNILNIKKRGSVASNYPELLSHWDYSKNKDVNPDNLLETSHVKIWWKCPKCGNGYRRELRWQVDIFKRDEPCLKCRKKNNGQ